jgi:hypothetical protein
LLTAFSARHCSKSCAHINSSAPMMILTPITDQNTEAQIGNSLSMMRQLMSPDTGVTWKSDTALVSYLLAAQLILAGVSETGFFFPESTPSTVCITPPCSLSTT